MQPSNGQALPLRDHSKPKRHTAKLVPFAIRQRIINALANGDSIRSISRAYHRSNNTVAAIRDEDWQQVAARKQRLAAQAERNATLSAELITEELESGKKIPLTTLNMTFGVNVDKLLQLRGEPGLTVHFDHKLSADDKLLQAMHAANARAEKRAKARSVELPALPPRDG